MSPKVASILKGHTVISRATSEPLPDNITIAKNASDFGEFPLLPWASSPSFSCVSRISAAALLQHQLCLASVPVLGPQSGVHLRSSLLHG